MNTNNLKLEQIDDMLINLALAAIYQPEGSFLTEDEPFKHINKKSTLHICAVTPVNEIALDKPKLDALESMMNEYNTLFPTDESRLDISDSDLNRLFKIYWDSFKVPVA